MVQSLGTSKVGGEVRQHSQAFWAMKDLLEHIEEFRAITFINGQIVETETKQGHSETNRSY